MINEAMVVARYLGVKTNNQLLYLEYNNAIQVLNLTLTPKEIKIRNKLLKFPFLLSFVDGGFAFLNPNHAIRKRLLLMAALIETDKKYVDQFIPENNISFPVLNFLYRGSLGMVKSFIGVIMLIVFRWN